MKQPDAVVFVIDDDAAMRRSMCRVISYAGFIAKSFAKAEEYLKHDRPDAPACMVLDVRLSGLSGLGLQKELNELGIEIPIIFVTGYGNTRMAVDAMKAGAADFLTKPFETEQLLDAIRQAIQKDRESRELSASLAELHGSYQSLTPREREVMSGVVTGKLNKQIAQDLGTTEKTIKFHRAHMMAKMHAPSLPDLVRMSVRLPYTSRKVSKET
ncbi:MAG TPA: response regulator [Verrucomicrobiae bacterium]|jgi:FixJ family two-component response regulator|nr:response regulator [Verrucomicrobiae bacterium]